MSTGPQIDANRPWPGLESYDEDSQQWFKGREQESEALLQLVQRETLSVLYGRSGLGKTSLLRAGLFPRLRAADILPVRLHLLLADDAPPLQQQVIAAIERESARCGVEVAPADDESLWAWFNRRNCEFWSADDRLLTPLLVFDQFEEIFTLGRENPQRRMRCDALLAELGDLVENRRPAALRERLEKDPDFAARFDARRPPPKILLSFREDYLADFDVLYDYVRARSSNRLRLLPMRGHTAQEAILAASPEHVDAEVATQIVRFIDPRPRPLDELVIEPALLSLVCHRLNARRLDRGQPRIGAELLSDGSAQAILTQFYEDAFHTLPPALRDFVEERLLTASGHRDSCALDNALATAGVDAASLQLLTDRRLLRREDRGGQLRLELIHDVLAPVARASRDARRERQRRRALRKRQRIIAVVMVALLGVLGVMGYLTWQTQVALTKAEQETQRAQQALVGATALKLAAQGQGIVTGHRPGIQRGLQQLVASARLADGAGEVVSALGASLQAVERLQRVIEAPPVLALALSPDGRHVVSGSDDRTLRLWELATGQPVGAPWKGHGGEILSVAFSPDGQHVVSGSDDRTLRLWEMASGQPVGAPWEGHSAYFRSVAFSPDGRHVVSGDNDGTLRLWQVATGQPVGAPWEGHSREVLSVAFSPDGHHVLSGSADRTLRLWEVATGHPVSAPWEGHSRLIRSIAFSPDGRYVVSGSNDRNLHLWEVATGQPIGAPWGGHRRDVLSVAFSPDGRYVMSGSADRTLRLWEVATGQPVGTPWEGHGGKVVGVAFSPDGRHMVSSSEDGSLRLWPAPAVWPDELCKKLTRNMSEQEWDEWVSPDIDYVVQCPRLPKPGPSPEEPPQAPPR
jgi:hypothetical protein